MLRTYLAALSTFVMVTPISASLAAEQAHEHGNKYWQGTITKVDVQTNTVTIKSIDKFGREHEDVVQITKFAKLLNPDGKEVTLGSFKAGNEVFVTIINDKVAQIRKQMQANIMKIDFQAGTITVKMKDKNDKEVERLFRLIDDVAYIDGIDWIGALGVFRTGDDVLVVAADGKITRMTKAYRQKNPTVVDQGSEKTADTK